MFYTEFRAKKRGLEQIRLSPWLHEGFEDAIYGLRRKEQQRGFHMTVRIAMR